MWPSFAFTVCFQLLTHIFKTLPLFFKTLHTNPRIAHTKCKMPHISCKMKHCIQNITNTSQKQTFANTFAIILIPVRFLCYIELCFVFCKKCFMKLKTESKADNYVWFWLYGYVVCVWFADLVCGSAVWVSAFRNCVTSKDFVCKQLKKTVKQLLPSVHLCIVVQVALQVGFLKNLGDVATVLLDLVCHS